MVAPLDDTSLMVPTSTASHFSPHEATFHIGAPPNKIDELDAIVNVTREYPFEYATVMFGYIMPFVLVLTLITNTLVVIVLYQRHMRTPTNIVLFTMAIVDLMTLLWPSPWYFYIYTLGYHDKFLYPPVACYAHHFMTDVIPVFFHTSSIWLALLLASQRYIYVCHPSLASTWCTVPRVRKAIVIILVIAFLHQITRFFDNKFEAVEIQYNQVQHRACKNDLSDWVHSIDIGVYYITYFTFRIVFVFIIPCVALITLNCLLFGALKRAENKRSELLNSKFRYVGGNRSSVAAFEGRQSSFMANSVVKNEPSATTNVRPSSGLYWPSRRKISSPLVRPTKNNTEVGDIAREKRQKYERISSSFRMRRNNEAAPGAAALFSRCENSEIQPDNKSTNRTVTPLNQTSDKTIVDGRRRFDGRSDSDESDIRLMDELEARRSSQRASAARSRYGMREEGKQRSKESNESYSFLSNQSKCRDENRSKSKTSTDNQSNGRDDDNTCPGCLVCEQQQMEDLKWCRRCLVSSTNDGTTVDEHHHHPHAHHQPVSQCSSLIGGITNTTTNEEVSSCGNTQNISSSIYVVPDGTLDGLETGSIREYNEGLLDTERESTSLHHNHNHNHNNNIGNNVTNETSRSDKRSKRNKKSVSADGETRRDLDLMKSNSIDSRLVCGCRMSPERETLYRCTRSNSSGRDGCQECCSARRCRKQFQLKSVKSDQAATSRSSMQKCVASCSSSDPCIKCNNQTQDSSGCKTATSVGEAQHTAGKTKTIPQSKSDYYGDRCGADSLEEPNKQRSNADIYLDGNAAATTTTTTTLYSTQANSVASLLQASQTNQTSQQKQSAASSQQNTQTRAKSPSFVSTTMGRGSRATLIGNSSSMNPPALVITGTNQTATLRTMDSNRTTLMLIVVVTVFLMVEVPVAIVTILHVILNTFDAFKDVEFSAYLSYIKLFTNFFIMISYSVNFTIYCSMSKKFRETFRHLFLCGTLARRKKAAGLLYHQTQHSQYINTNTNNNNFSNTNPNQLQSHDMGQGLSQSTNLNHSTATNLKAPGAQINEQTAAMRYAPYRARASSQQQECEL